jgi:hypothetical protein
MNNLEQIVKIALDAAVDVYGSDELLEDFELEIRRRLMQTFCTPTVPLTGAIVRWPPTSTGGSLTNTGTKELLNG